MTAAMLFANVHIHSYSYTGDIAVMALCIGMAILVYMCQLKKDIGLLILYSLLGEIFVAAASHVIFEQELLQPEPSHAAVYICRVLHHLMLTFVLLLYSLYLYAPLWIPHARQQNNMITSTVMISAVAVLDIIATILRFGFYFSDTTTVMTDINFYWCTITLQFVHIFALIIRYRSRLIRQVFWSLLGLNLIAAGLFIVQFFTSNFSYTTIAFFVPIIGIIFMFHANPFDVATGAVSEAFLNNELEEAVSHSKKIFLLSCRIRGFEGHMKLSDDFRKEYYTFLRNNVRKGVLYHFADGKLVLTLKRSDATPETVQKMLSDFEECYRHFRQEYKVVILESFADGMPEITSAQDYIRLLDFAENHMSYNKVRRITSEDVFQYYSSRYILSEMEDIVAKGDFNDPRVLVYCQPVYNLKTRRYDTAEALMRLNLEKTGIVFPDQFIPLAEQNKLLHTLSLIILNKTCAALHELIGEDYEIQRASVNFAVSDLHDIHFCTDVKEIIERNGIPYDCIAVEITESQNEAEFRTMKETIMEMQKLGIKFYLDDFGTGYSNFERIMELPFDIIKFDRSLLLESSRSDPSYYMVSTFAEMFHKLQYSVLFEGVENNDDEAKCIAMNASYLQGYKYSRPIPINELRRFLHRAAHT